MVKAPVPIKFLCISVKLLVPSMLEEVLSSLQKEAS